MLSKIYFIIQNILHEILYQKEYKLSKLKNLRMITSFQRALYK